MYITTEKFAAATGAPPTQDDLERCNCHLQGNVHHRSCGWCHISNLPVFMCAGKHEGPCDRMAREQL